MFYCQPLLPGWQIHLSAKHLPRSYCKINDNGAAAVRGESDRGQILYISQQSVFFFLALLTLTNHFDILNTFFGRSGGRKQRKKRHKKRDASSKCPVVTLAGLLTAYRTAYHHALVIATSTPTHTRSPARNGFYP